MKLRRIACMALSAALLASAALAVEGDAPAGNPDAQNAVMIPLESGEGAGTPAAEPTYEIARRDAAMPVLVWGEAALDGERVVLKTDDEYAAHKEIVLNLSEETVILDAVTGAVKTADDLKDGEILYAYAGPVMTRSLPPISNAVLVLCNVPSDIGVPTYAEVEQVEVKEDGSVSVLMTGSIVLHLNADTELLSYKTKDVPTLDSIRPGTRLLSWYSMVMESFPAQAVPDKVMVFPYAYEAWAAMGEDGISVNGEAVALAENETPFAQDGKLMVPVRAFAEALGCQVAWNPETPELVAVERDGAPLYSFQIGGETATVEGDMVMGMTAPAVAKDGVTFMAAEDLVSYHGIKLEGNWPLMF